MAVEDDRGSLSGAAESSGHLANEGAARLLDLGGVSEEPVATAFDADKLGSQDAGRRPGGEPIRRERVGPLR
jgi:hypothetical protein